MQRSSRAIILRRTAYGDADWIVTLFAREGGRLSGIAKSARASRRRFAGALEPGAIVDVRYWERLNAPLVRLEEAVVAAPTNGAMKSLPRIGAMARLLALALAFLPEHEENPEKFDLLERRILRLCEAEPAPAEEVAFELAWLARCGFGPTISCCTACGRSAGASGRWSFDFERGGMLCVACGSQGGVRITVPEGARAAFLSLGEDAALLTDSQAEAAGVVVSRYIDHIIGRPLAVR